MAGELGARSRPMHSASVMMQQLMPLRRLALLTMLPTPIQHRRIRQALLLGIRLLTHSTALRLLDHGMHLLSLRTPSHRSFLMIV